MMMTSDVSGDRVQLANLKALVFSRWESRSVLSFSGSVRQTNFQSLAIGLPSTGCIDRRPKTNWPKQLHWSTAAHYRSSQLGCTHSARPMQIFRTHARHCLFIGAVRTRTHHRQSGKMFTLKKKSGRPLCCQSEALW